MPRPEQTAPIYIPSYGRARIATTPRVLDQMGVDWRMIIEADQLEEYAAHWPRGRLLTLDPAYQAAYRTHDPAGDAAGKPPGSGPARNFAWDHAIRQGAAWHWVIDDNIRYFERFHDNRRIPMADATYFAAMEDFAGRYTNLALAGPNYVMFTPNRLKQPPVRFNRRVYSCILLRNDLPFRWRGRYNEDTILSLDVLKAGWCTALFHAFLCWKLWTQQMRGGNTDTIYAAGTLAKSRLLVELHPDVAKVVWRYKRWHHQVDYSPFAGNRLQRRPDWQPPAENPYRFRLIEPGGG